MVIETVTPEHGRKEHIVINVKGGLYGIVVLCGHTHFDGPKNEYDDIEDIENLCQCCKYRY